MDLINLENFNILEQETSQKYSKLPTKRMEKYMLSNKFKKLKCKELERKLIYLWKNIVSQS